MSVTNTAAIARLNRVISMLLLRRHDPRAIADFKQLLRDMNPTQRADLESALRDKLVELRTGIKVE